MFKLANKYPKLKKASLGRRLIQLAIFLLVIGFLIYSWTFEKSGDFVFNSQNPAQQAQIVDPENPEKFVKRIRVGDIELNIPVVFFRSSLSSKTEYRDIYLHGYYPDFNWVKIEPYETRYYNPKIVVVGISDLASKNTIKRIADNNVGSGKGPAYSMTDPDYYGLQLWESSVSPDHKDFLVHIITNEADTFIRCSNYESEWIANVFCNMNFREDDFFYSVRLDRKYLPEWREIKGKSISFIQQFKTKPNDPSMNKE